MTAPPHSSPHHPVFDGFERTVPADDEVFHYDFVGVKIRHAYEVVMPDDADPASPPTMSSGRSQTYADDPTFPNPNSEDYFEWIDLLTAITEARGEFVMIELGAGYGRWVVNAAAAIRRRRNPDPLSVRLIAVEADQERFSWMNQHFRDNGIDPAGHRLIHAGVSVDRQPLFIPFSQSQNDFGARLYSPPHFQKLTENLPPGRYLFQIPDGSRPTYEKVATLPLEDILPDGPVDLIDMDIQGYELVVLSHSLDAVCRKVKRLHIGTHGPDIERKIISLLANNGWELQRYFLGNEYSQSPYGRFRVGDGIQSWKNRRFA